MEAIAANVLVTLMVLGGIGLTAIGLPGNLLIVLTAFAYGFYTGFNLFSYGFLLATFSAYLAGEAIEFIAGALGAKRAKASGRAVFAAFAGALAGGLIGTSVIPIIGSILGAAAGGFAASYIAEYSKTKDARQAGAVAKSVTAGHMAGLAVKLVIAVGMATAIVIRLPW